MKGGRASSANGAHLETTAVSHTRLAYVDALRGAAMVIMALDHVRDFFHAGAMHFAPDNLALTTPILFFTSWIHPRLRPGVRVHGWRRHVSPASARSFEGASRTLSLDAGDLAGGC